MKAESELLLDMMKRILIALSFVYSLCFEVRSFQLNPWILGSFRTAEGDEAIISWLKRSELLFSIILGLDLKYCGPRSKIPRTGQISCFQTVIGYYFESLSLVHDNICDIAESRCNFDTGPGYWPGPISDTHITDIIGLSSKLWLNSFPILYHLMNLILAS